MACWICTALPAVAASPTNPVTLRDFDDSARGFSFQKSATIDVFEDSGVTEDVDLIYDDGLAANNKSLGSSFRGKGGVVDLGKKNIADISEAPKDGYAPLIKVDGIVEGHAYCIRCGDGRQFAVIEIVSINKKRRFIEFRWKYPIQAPQIETSKPREVSRAPKILLGPGTQQDADAAFAVASQFLESWQMGQYEKASLFVAESLRGRFIAYIKNRKITLETIEEIMMYQGTSTKALRARVQFTSAPNQRRSIDMIFQNGKWWITAE
jgi:hypothetical protein